jgi:recombination protein RecA
MIDPVIKEIRDKLNKKFGIISQDFRSDVKYHIDTIPTQSLRLNHLLRGGIPRGRITEIFGQEHTGKTSLYLGIIAEAQKAGGRAALFDLESAWFPDHAQMIGVDFDKLLYLQPDTAEETIDILDNLIRTNEFDVIGIDSVAALEPAAELEAEMSQQTIGLQARLMSKAMRKIIPALKNSKTALVFINQQRVKIGAYAPHGQVPMDTTGGNALKYYASTRIEIRRGADLKNGDTVIGHELKVLGLKNRGAIPKQRCSFNVIYGKGIDRLEEICGLSVDLGVAKKGGAWVSVIDSDGQVISLPDSEPLRFNGMEKYLAAVHDSVPLQEYLTSRVMGTLRA